jgi:hypothetical protein
MPARAQDLGEDPILVVKTPVGVLDDDLTTGHRLGLLRLIR